MDKTAAKSGCVICGDPLTVRSHLIPRALMRDLIDTPQGLTVISKLTRRVALSQSGLVDINLLCSAHEKATEKFDKHGIEFCRNFVRNAGVTESGHGFLVPNPKPHFLANFAYACVWRTVISRYGRDIGLNLGRYEAIMRECIFEGNECELPVLIGFSHLREANGQTANLCVPPFYSRAKPGNRWVMTVGGLDFHVFCDNRKMPNNFVGALANRDTTLLCGKTDGQLFTTANVLGPILDNIRPKP